MGNKAAYDLWWKMRSSTAWTSSCSPTATATAIRARKELPELGWGTWQVLDTDHPAVLAHRCDWQGRGCWCCTTSAPSRSRSGWPLALAGFGYRWLRLPG